MKDPEETSTFPLVTLIEVIQDYDRKAYLISQTFYLKDLDKAIIDKELKKVITALDKQLSPVFTLFFVRYS